MEGLGGYASSSSGSDEEGDNIGATAATAPKAGGDGAAAAAAAEAARAQRVAAMERSDSEDSDSDDSDDSDDDEGEHLADKSRHGNSKASLIALPSASDLMAGAGAGGSGIYHNPYEKQEIHTKRKLGDNENNTIFKKVHAKKKVYGQGQKPKTNSSVARSWYALRSMSVRLWNRTRLQTCLLCFCTQDIRGWCSAATSTSGTRTSKCCDRGHCRVECYEKEGDT